MPVFNEQLLISAREVLEYDDTKPEAFLALAQILHENPDAHKNNEGITIEREGFNAVLNAMKHKDGIGDKKTDALKYMKGFIGTLIESTQEEAFYTDAVNALESLSDNRPDIATLMLVLDCSKQIAEVAASEDALRKVVSTCEHILSIKPTLDVKDPKDIKILNADSAVIDGTAGDYLMRLYKITPSFETLDSALTHYYNAFTGDASEYRAGIEDCVNKIRDHHSASAPLEAAQGFLKLFKDTAGIQDLQKAFEYFEKLSPEITKQEKNILLKIQQFCESSIKNQGESDEYPIEWHKLAGQCCEKLFPLTNDVKFISSAFEHYDSAQDHNASTKLQEAWAAMERVCNLIPKDEKALGVKLWGELSALVPNKELYKQKVKEYSEPDDSSGPNKPDDSSGSTAIVAPVLNLNGSLEFYARQIKSNLGEKGMKVKTDPKWCGGSITLDNNAVISTVEEIMIATLKDLAPGGNLALVAINHLTPFIQKIASEVLSHQKNTAYTGTLALFNSVMGEFVPMFNNGAQKWIDDNPQGQIVGNATVIDQ